MSEPKRKSLTRPSGSTPDDLYLNSDGYFQRVCECMASGLSFDHLSQEDKDRMRLFGEMTALGPLNYPKDFD